VTGISQDFWAKLRRLVVADDGPVAPLPEPVPEYLRALRRRLADRRSPETLTLYRRLARLAGERVEGICAADFDNIFSSEQVSCLVQEVFGQLFNGGLAAFRGRCEADLVAFVQDRADRVLLRAVVAEWTDHEVRCSWRARYRDLFSPEEADDLASEAVGELLRSALASFRGASAPELYGFARTVAHRTVSRAARRRCRDRNSLALLRSQQERPGTARYELPTLSTSHPLPLSLSDRDYLTELISVDGSRSQLARLRGVNRSAVTKMVQRILVRLDELDEDQRAQVGQWAEQTWTTFQEARAGLQSAE
jgi:hypothetical protein